MRDEALRYLRQSLGDGDAEFREGQWPAIEALLGGRRILVVQRTGWGKSVVYFVATRLLRDRGAGPTLLVSPLLALMRNQIEAAARIGIRAATINSANTDEWDEVKRRLVRNEIDVLLVSPERLANESFREDVLLPVGGRIGLFVVDEAHCISDWGHDFRPDYRRIVGIIRMLPPGVPVIATTATANDRVVEDVRYQMGDVEAFRGPLVRSSLRLQNVRLPSQAARLAWLAERIPTFHGSGIVYTLTVRDSERVAAWLKRKGISACAYHGDSMDRVTLEEMLLGNQVKALVATVALGMGFDKPDLGFVVHFQRPGSVVHYYQQVGRAGRAVDEAYGILLNGREDDEIIDYFIATAFPPQAHVDEVLRVLDAGDGLSVPGIEAKLNLSRSRIEKALKFLALESPAPVVKWGAKWFRTAARYVLDTDRIERICALRRAEQRQMQEYMETGGCLMRFLASALDDPHAADCGRCANCCGGEIVPRSYDRDLASEAVAFLRHHHGAIEPRKLWVGTLESHGFRGRIGPDLANETGRALCVYGDAGWGELVRQGKYETSRYADDLVRATARMVSEWSPRPKPEWLTCVPSTRRPELVSDFARRLAAELGIPFCEAVRKVADHAPQKEMANSAQQLRNLDGVFAIDASRMGRGPALLVDDVVDSGWTMTVAGALLRRAGCPAVFPVALADASQGGG